jgi:hypothetical protein
MKRMIELTDQELGELEILLKGGLEDVHAEIRRTENFVFREHLDQQLKSIQSLLAAVHRAEKQLV